MLTGVTGIAAGRALRQGRAGRRRCVQKHVRGQRCRTIQPAIALAGVGLQQRALEQLPHHSEREPLLELRRPCAQHVDAKVDSPQGPRLEQPRLPNPRGTFDNEHTSASLAHGL